MEAQGGRRSLSPLCADCVSFRGMQVLWYSSDPWPTAPSPSLMSSCTLQPPPQEVPLSHHSGIKGEQAASRAMLHEHIPSARVCCHAGRGRHCWNAVCHCIIDGEECVCVCRCVCRCLCVSRLSPSCYTCLPMSQESVSADVAKKL